MTNRVTITDIRRAGFCARGIRRWFEDNDLDFKDFLKNGISKSDFLATEDGRAKQVVDRMERNNG